MAGSRNGKFDVFLAHNSKDRQLVSVVAKKLKREKIEPWVDREQIPPGRWFVDAIQGAIAQVNATVVFFGKHGLGKWQTLELRSLVSQCVECGIPVIPVFLPKAKKLPKEWVFLKELHWVKFRTSVDESEGFSQLVWGITGSKHQNQKKRGCA